MCPQDEFSQTFGEQFEDDYEPLFSVIIVCRNQAAYLPEAVESLLRQNSADLETIIINDGSTDDSIAVARALADKYPELKILVIEQEGDGLAVARNIGIAAASGEWIAPLDSDSVMGDGWLGNVAKAIDEFPQANAFTGAYRPLGGPLSGNVEEVPAEPWKLADYNAENLRERCNLLTNTVYRRSLWLACGGYDASHPFGMEDWHFWLKAQLHGFTPVCLPVPMVYYRRHEDDSGLTAPGQQADSIALHQTILTEVYPLNTVMEAHRQLMHMAPETETAVRAKLAKLPKNPMPHFWLGLAHEGRGELEEAAARYREALDLPWPRVGRSFKSGAWQPQMRLDGLKLQKKTDS